jgi:hypothetical protein
MDDFLYNLRKSVEERNKSGATQRGGDRRCGMDRRNRKPQKHSTDLRNYPPYNRNLHEIRLLLEKFVEGQGRLEVFEEKRLELEARRTKAMERIADSLNRITETSNDAGPVFAAPPAGASIPQSDVKARSKTAAKAVTAAELMTQLRAEGKSYEKIANALEAEGFSTVSGRGRWRGQTVKRELAKLGVQG